MILSSPSFKLFNLEENLDRQLSWSDPRFLDLKNRYKALNHVAASSTAWDETHVKNQIHLPYFRGDNAYVWQIRDGNELESYKNTAAYLKAHDELNLFSDLIEDGSFGIYSYEVEPGVIVSRDLLDSILEINYLNKMLSLESRDSFSVLDVGSGYGRLAHRMLSAFSNLSLYTCVDAIAESTYLCEFYLRYRGLSRRSRVVALDRLNEIREGKKIDVAVNIHSFSECGVEAIQFWIEFVRALEIPYFFIVPNANRDDGKSLYSSEWCGKETRFEHLLANSGYELYDMSPKYQPNGSGLSNCVSPTYYHLYRLA